MDRVMKVTGRSHSIFLPLELVIGHVCCLVTLCTRPGVAVDIVRNQRLVKASRISPLLQMAQNDHATIFLPFIYLVFFGRFQHEEEFLHVHNKRE